MRWKNGETTQEPLLITAVNAPLPCAICAKKKGLLNAPGWKRFKCLAKHQEKLFTEINKAKIRLHHQKPKFKCGIELPRDHVDAVRLNKENGNSLWQEAMALEMKLMEDYSVFEDAGEHAHVPPGCKNI